MNIKIMLVFYVFKIHICIKYVHTGNIIHTHICDICTTAKKRKTKMREIKGECIGIIGGGKVREMMQFYFNF